MSVVRDILGTVASTRETFDRVARLTARALRAPVAQVNLVSEDLQVTVSSAPSRALNAVREVPLDHSYCQHVVRTGEPFLVQNAREDPRVRENPASREIVSYASVPLMVAEDLVVGTLCVFDFAPRWWTDEEVGVLTDLGEFVISEIERRGHTEAELRHLTAILESERDAVVGMDVVDRIASWNPGAERMFGYAAADVLGRSILCITPAERHGQVKSVLAKVHRGETAPRVDTHCVRRDGSRISVSVVATPVVDLAGRVIGATVLLRDITSRVAGMKALEESEERFRQLADNVSAVFWLRDVTSGQLLYVNPAYERIWGRSVRDLRRTDRVWLEAVHPDDREKVLSSHDPERPREYEIEYRITHADGEQRWIYERGFPVLGDHGEVVRMAGIAEDITERIQTQAALHTSEARFRALIENSTEIISVFSADGVIRYESPSVTGILGYTPEEMEHRSAFDLVHPEDLTEAREAFARIIAASDPISVEVRYRHRNGSYRVFSVTAVNLLHDPVVAGVVANSRDITELREREERLRQAHKMEAVGRLAGGIAHDFNNLITIVKGGASMALMDLPADSPVRPDLHQIVEAADRAAKLTHQLLVFSRQQVLQPVVLNLNDVVRGMEAMLRRTLGGDIEFITVLEPRLGQVIADPGQMEQILLNLAVNARDAMPDGGSLVTETHNVDLSGETDLQSGISAPPGPYVVLAVSDTGTGIPNEVRERIFEPFFTTKPPGKGTGLGLATVYGIVQQSSGHISVSTQEGGGTTFEIYLPRTNTDGQEPDPGIVHQGGRNPTVLLVEDEPMVRSLARRTLERMHCTILEAEDGEAALRLADEHDGQIDLLFTDMVMPRMGGKQLAEILTARWPSMRVLLTSGYTDETVIPQDLTAGPVTFLRKPYDYPTLGEKVAEVLGQPRRSR